MKRIIVVLMMFVAMAALPCASNAEVAERETIILYTNDVHCYIDNYPLLAAYRAQLMADGHEVITVDAGDAIQGLAIGEMTEGSAAVDLMNAVGYDYAVPGNHEFDYGMEVFLGFAKEAAQYEYLCCNFVDLRNGLPVLPSWDMVRAGGEDIAILGIVTPESYTKSPAAHFQNEKGEQIYGFSEEKFYNVIQASVDEAVAAGADRIIVVGHLGVSDTTTGWKSTDVIANTTGIDVFIDAHSHEIIPEVSVANEEGEPVLLTSTGCKFQYFGQLTLNRNGSEDAELIEPGAVAVSDPAAAEIGRQVQQKVDEYNRMVSAQDSVVGFSEVELTMKDPDTGRWVIRTAETNMGDFVADAYRNVSGADIALVSSVSIRAALDAGEVTRKELMDVNPSENKMCIVKATGQQILDALEFGVRMYPAECDGFLQVSGLEFELCRWLPSPVITDEKGNYLEINGDYPRRVANVTVDGVPLDPGAEYTVVSSHYVLKEGGEGFTMFADSQMVECESLPLDSDMLSLYLQGALRGVISESQYGNPRGDGRITVLSEEVPLPGSGENSEDMPSSNENNADKSPSQGSEGNPQTGDEFNIILPLCLMLVSIYAVRSKKEKGTLG